MKKLLFMMCLCLSGCSRIDYICHDKDPNTMTEREFELCKAYLSRPKTIITNNNNNTVKK